MDESGARAATANAATGTAAGTSNLSLTSSKTDAIGTCRSGVASVIIAYFHIAAADILVGNMAATVNHTADAVNAAGVGTGIGIHIGAPAATAITIRRGDTSSCYWSWLRMTDVTVYMGGGRITSLMIVSSCCFCCC
jgi:hypothetical protein